MPLPQILAHNLLPLGALAPVGPPPGGATAAHAPPGGAAAGRNLPFTMHHQEQDNWCWSAVAVSVAEFYDASTTWNAQCALASAELSPLVCCPTGSNPSCDVPYFLDAALSTVGRFNTWASGSLTVDEIQAEIENTPTAHVIGVRIGWYNAGGVETGGHFVIVSGFSKTSTTETVRIDDPWYGRSTLDLATFQSAYQGNGHWTHTYWTQ